MTVDLTGGTAVITGSAGGIGLGLARACLTRDMQVVLSDLDEERLAATVMTLTAEGAAVVGRAADVRNPADVSALRDLAMHEFGQIDLVCNNAGIGFTQGFTETEPKDWDLVLDINVKGVANGIHAFLPTFLEQGHGHISATASLSGIVADPGLGVYNASKFAVVGMMEALALEFLNTGLSASVLCPGPVATDLIVTSEKQTGVSANQDVHEYLNRGMHPEEVGEIAIAGISEGLYWLLSHPELSHRLAAGRTQAMIDGGTLFVDELDWTDQ
jgi:NAD(P)-dependent dehydrogenase (short-subunit alcohol dehydrogenase family)